MILTKLKASALNKRYSAITSETSDKQITANTLYRNYGFLEIRIELIDSYYYTWQ